MLKKDSSVFLHVPGEGPERVLHPGAVVSLNEDELTIQLESAKTDVKAGVDVLLYFESSRQFLQQAARITRVKQDAGDTTLELETTSDPASAESRDSYRVSALAAELRSDFGSEHDCEVLDVSATGFSVYASKDFQVGHTVDVVLKFEGEELTGRVIVQSVKRHSPTRVRYGVRCLDDSKAGGLLKLTLPRINETVQRQQLRRLSGHD